MARPIAEDFGRAFKHAYQSAGLSQVQLATRLQERGWVKVDQSQVSKWARGLFVPPLEILPDVDEACGHPRGYLLELAGYVDADALVARRAEEAYEASEATRAVAAEARRRADARSKAPRSA